MPHKHVVDISIQRNSFTFTSRTCTVEVQCPPSSHLIKLTPGRIELRDRCLFASNQTVRDFERKPVTWQVLELVYRLQSIPDHKKYGVDLRDNWIASMLRLDYALVTKGFIVYVDGCRLHHMLLDMFIL